MGLPGRAYAFRTAGDLPEFAETDRVRWEEPVVATAFSEALPTELTSEDVSAAASMAKDAWTSVDCPVVTFVDHGWSPAPAVPGDGIVTIQFIGSGWSLRGFSPDAPAATDVIYDRGHGNEWRIVDADIYLNAEAFQWSALPDEPTGYYLAAVLTHELGHVLGLLHPCEDNDVHAPVCTPDFSGATMYPDYTPGQSTLASDDEAGVCFLYELPACASTGCEPGSVCTPEGCGTVCDGLVCGVGERCGPGGCTAEPCVPGSCERGCEASCESMGGEAGDPCVSDLDCFSGHRAAGAYCSFACVDGAGCPEGFVCAGKSGVDECVATSGTFGDSCLTGDDCTSGLCLIEAPEQTCTRPCGGAERDCPGGHMCASVDGIDVCVRPASGCAVAPGGTDRVGSLLLVAAFSWAGCAARRRRRGRSAK